MEKIWNKASINDYQKCFDILNTNSLFEKETFRKFAIELFEIAKKQSNCPDCKLKFIDDEKNNLGFGEINGYIPFIIYSPQIGNKIIIEEPVFQMDIYPTLLSLTGCEDYYWKGFGVNLLENGSWNIRTIQPNEAQELSDKMIRANYFKNIMGYNP